METIGIILFFLLVFLLPTPEGRKLIIGLVFKIIFFTTGMLIGFLKFLFKWLFVGVKPERGRYDSARFANKSEKLKLMSRDFDGWSVNGEYFVSLHRSFESAILLGSTGSGKSRVNIFSTILQQSETNLVILDPSKEIRKYCIPYLVQQGYEIRCLDVDNLENTNTVDVIGNTKTDLEILDVCRILVAADGRNKSHSKSSEFFEESTVNLFFLLTKCLKNYRNGKYANLPNLRFLLTQLQSQNDSVNEFFAEAAINNPKLFSEVLSMMGNADKETRANIISSALSKCSNYASEECARLVGPSNNLRFDDLRDPNKKICILINVSEERQRVFSVLVASFISQVMDFSNRVPAQENYRPILFILEEFATAISYLDGLPERVMSLRKKGVGILICLQSLASLKSKYGDDCHAIEANCKNLIIHGGVGYEDAKKVSELCGKYDHKFKESGYAEEYSDKRTYKESVIARNLLSPSEVQAMTGILYKYASEPPVLLERKIHFDQNPRLKDHVLPPVELHFGEAKPIEYLPLETNKEKQKTAVKDKAPVFDLADYEKN